MLNAVFAFPPLTKMIRSVMIALFAVFVALALVERFASLSLFGLLALAPHPSIGWLWQAFTYPFATPIVPESVTSLLFTLFFLYLLGAPFEQRFGPRRTLIALAVSVVAAAFTVMLVGLTSTQLAPLFGASTMTFGIFVASIASMRAGTVSWMGVVPMRPWHAVAISLGFGFLSYLTSGNPTPFIADIGAIAGGYAYGRYLNRPQGGSRTSRRAPKKKMFEVIPGGRTPSDPPKWLN